MAEYIDALDPGDRLSVEVSASGEKLKFITKFSRAAEAVYLRSEELRKLRDQINEHLNETPKPLPVGTIVVGEGLTEAQKTHCSEAVEWGKLRGALNCVSWLRTQEGGLFWGAVRDRARNIEASMHAEKKRREVPEVTSVQGITAANISGPWVIIGVEGETNKRSLSPNEARRFSAALLKHADLAEKKSSQG